MKVWTEKNKELLEDFQQQYSHGYNDSSSRELDELFKYADGVLTKLECDELLQQYYSDLSGECDREGFCE